MPLTRAALRTLGRHPFKLKSAELNPLGRRSLGNNGRQSVHANRGIWTAKAVRRAWLKGRPNQPGRPSLLCCIQEIGQPRRCPWRRCCEMPEPSLLDNLAESVCRACMRVASEVHGETQDAEGYDTARHHGHSRRFGCMRWRGCHAGSGDIGAPIAGPTQAHHPPCPVATPVTTGR